MSVTKLYLFPASDFKYESDGTCRLKRKYGERKRQATVIETDPKRLYDHTESIPHTINVKFK